MPKVSYTPPDFTCLPLRSSSPNAATAARRALGFDQMCRDHQILRNQQPYPQYDRDYKERKSGQRLDEMLPLNRQQTPRHQSQPVEPYANHFDRSISRDCTPTMQPTGLWCDAHKSRIHNTEDCVWLKWQNAQQLIWQEFH
uniref:Uncharacterized protein n=1 Tax=Romanomermis culicivorax TaxID=13658 RepID=A0A915JS70_ROMCU